jgi:hypothetical protein
MRSAAGAWRWISLNRRRRCLTRHVSTHHQKSVRSRDRRTALYTHRSSSKSSRRTVSARASRAVSTSYGPRSPSMIQSSTAASSVCTATQRSRSSGARSADQKCASSSTTGIPVTRPSRTDRVVLPAPPRPSTTTRRTQLVSLSKHRSDLPYSPHTVASKSNEPDDPGSRLPRKRPPPRPDVEACRSANAAVDDRRTDEAGEYPAVSGHGDRATHRPFSSGVTTAP